MSDKKKQPKNKKYKAVIVGAGRIAAGFDGPKSKHVLTHAHAYRQSSQVELIGFFDIDAARAGAAAKKWSCQAFADLDTMCEEVNPDIVSICVPDQQHYSTLLKISQHHPRIVICEKPLTTDNSDTKKIIKLYHRERIPILVNFSRRFDATVQKIRTDLRSGVYGKVLASTALYTKGVLHNGSHLIDLARYLFGEATTIRSLYQVRDYEGTDATVGAFLSFEKCPQFFMVAGDERAYSVFEIDILCEKKRLKLLDFGWQYTEQEIVRDPLYAGYKMLGSATLKKTQLLGVFSQMVNNAVDFLGKGSPLICTLDDAAKTQAICAYLLK